MIGQILSHYKILEQLGAGGVGVVYKAQDTRLLRYVAVKILAAELMGDERRRQRFIKEAQTASSLNHPNICTIHDVDEDDGVHFIVMELIEGETLRARLNRRGLLPEAEVVDLALKVCDALAAVHEKSTFHRDIKPDNIMVSRQGAVKVMDFGLAKLATEAAETVAEIAFEQNLQFGIGAPKNTYVESVVLTNLSGLLGTVHYMSPEQVQGKTIDERSDIFSLGVTLFELLHGKRPFEGESNLAILSKIINDPPQPIDLGATRVSPELQHIILRCVAKEPAQRFRNVHEIIANLRLLTPANLTLREEKRAPETVKITPEAYDDYLKGTFYFDNFTPMNLHKSIEFFKRAVQADPNFVEAHVGLARALTHMGMTNWGPAAQAFAEARTVAMQALALEPENAEAMVILALIKFQTEYDWTGAAKLFKQAMARNPESVIVNDSYAFYLTDTTQHEEAIRCARFCLNEVPQPCYYQVRLGWTYLVARQYDEAIAQLRETQLSFPELAFADMLLSWSYAMKGLAAQALAECAKAEAKGVPSWQASWIYALVGKTEEAKARLDVFRQQNLPDEWGVLFATYATLGEIDLAFEELEKVYEKRLSHLVCLKAFPQYDGLRSDPRYFALLKKLGMENDGPNHNRGKLEARTTNNPEALENYLKGTVYFDNFTPVNLQKSKEHFELAIAEDSGFAQAYVGLAQTLVHLGLKSLSPPKIAFPQAREVAIKALELDKGLAEAHAVLGMIKFTCEWDWAGAKIEFERAIDLSSKSILVNDAYAFYLTALEQHKESISRVEHNVAKNPSSVYHNLRLGWSYYMARQYNDAIIQSQKTHELHRELSYTHLLLAWSYTRKGMHVEALGESEKAQIKGVPRWYFGRIYAEAGKIDEARKGLQALLSENIPAYFFIADIYLALGNLDAAFAYFEKAYEENFSEVTWLKVTPQFDAMRADPRYFALLKKIGLEE
jgi:serine/threonine protein kinase/Tfp pilus assembly protein PilF